MQEFEAVCRRRSRSRRNKKARRTSERWTQLGDNIVSVESAGIGDLYGQSPLPSHSPGNSVGRTTRHAGAWWLDYAEHVTVLALAGLLAASRGPGWRILRGLCGAVWLYLGLHAALVLPHHPGSWGRIGGALALLLGIGFGLATWRGPERQATSSLRRALP